MVTRGVFGLLWGALFAWSCASEPSGGRDAAPAVQRDAAAGAHEDAAAALHDAAPSNHDDAAPSIDDDAASAIHDDAAPAIHDDAAPAIDDDAAVLAPDAGAPAGPDASAATMTRTFQQGVDGYQGAKSVGISTYSGLGAPGEWNANGATFADGDADWCTGTNIPPSPYDEVWLLRFDDLDLPPGAQIVEATLTVNAFANDHDAGVYFAGAYLLGTWNASVPASCAGCSDAPVGWRYRDGPSAPWGQLGASQPGVDVDATRTFRVPETGAFALGYTPNAYTAHLDPSIVQGWLSGVGGGLRLVTGVPGVHVSYVQPQRSPAGRPLSLRPLLRLTYVP